ncbi:MAG: hypothetical protein ABJN40_11735 [Sneathiella sp.]
MKQNFNTQKPLMLAAGLMLAGFALVVFLQFSPIQKKGDLAVIFSPSLSLTQILARLSFLPVDFVRVGLFENIVIIRPKPSFSMTVLQETNPWFVVSALANGGCLFLKQKPISKVRL